MLGYARNMKKQLYLFLLLVFVLTPLSAKVYKWVDEEGVVQYSSRPHEGAETVKVPKTTASTPESTEEGASEEGTETTDGTYETFSIASPENGETIRSNGGNVTISFFIEPLLQEGHKFILYLDGQKLEGEHTSARLGISQMKRGTHTIKADLLDAEGNKIASTSSVVFHLRKEAITQK